MLAAALVASVFFFSSISWWCFACTARALTLIFLVDQLYHFSTLSIAKLVWKANGFTSIYNIDTYADWVAGLLVDEAGSPLATSTHHATHSYTAKKKKEKSNKRSP